MQAIAKREEEEEVQRGKELGGGQPTRAVFSTARGEGKQRGKALCYKAKGGAPLTLSAVLMIHVSCDWLRNFGS